MCKILYILKAMNKTPESCIKYRHLVSHMDPTYLDPSIYTLQATCRVELENISHEMTSTEQKPIEPITEKLTISHCPSMEIQTVRELVHLFTLNTPLDPFELKKIIYGPGQDLRMPLESKCHYSIIEFANTHTVGAEGGILRRPI